MSHFHKLLQAHSGLSISCFVTTLLFLTSRDPQAEGGTLICIFSNGRTTFKCFTNGDNYLRMADLRALPADPFTFSCRVPQSISLSFICASSASLNSLCSVEFNWHDLHQNGGAARLVGPVTAAERVGTHSLLHMNNYLNQDGELFSFFQGHCNFYNIV